MTCILIVLKYVFPFRFSCTPNYPEMTRHNPCKRVITDKFMVKITKNAQSSLQVAYKTRHLGGPYHVVPCINLQSTVRLEIFEVIIVRNLCRDHKKHSHSKNVQPICDSNKNFQEKSSPFAGSQGLSKTQPWHKVENKKGIISDKSANICNPCTV
jgi:hypothetical protein